MLQRWGMLNWNSPVSSSAACPVMVLRQVRNGEQVAVLIEGQVAVHHGAEADGANRPGAGVPYFSEPPR
jgi:hypothetical protein